MKYRKTTFVLAVTSALCATSATASIKEDCKFLRTHGEAEIGKWVDRQSKLLEMANAQAEIPSRIDYVNKKVGPQPTFWEEYERLWKKQNAVGLTGFEWNKFKEWKERAKKRTEDIDIAVNEWRALSSTKLGKILVPPVVELNRAEQLATIYTAFCKR